jgi:hypothetical protein
VIKGYCQQLQNSKEGAQIMESLVRHSSDISYNFFFKNSNISRLEDVVLFPAFKFCSRLVAEQIMRQDSHQSSYVLTGLVCISNTVLQYGRFYSNFYNFTKLNIHKSQKLGKCGAYLNINLFPPRSSISL